MPHSRPAPLSGRPVTISGLGSHVPSRVITNNDLASVLDTSDEWIKQRTGISERRVIDDHQTTSDLGVTAGRAALADAGLEPESIDLVITATVSPDRIMPATASRIALECGCGYAGAYDLLAGCTGFVYGLAMAASAVAAGLHEHVLVVGAEALSRITDWEDRSTAVLFGDGAGAAVVSPLAGSADVAPSAGILGFDLGGDGSGDGYLMVPAGGAKRPASHETVENREHYIKMNGKEIFKFATRVVAESAGRLLECCGLGVDDVDLFVSHQANLRIIDAAAEKLGIAGNKVYTNVHRYGNTSCASIPLCLGDARAEGRLKAGDLVLLVGFGAGLTWGACLLEWGHTGGGEKGRS